MATSTDLRCAIEDGSWDTGMGWGAIGGRVYHTAINALSMEVYYRYLPMYAK